MSTRPPAHRIGEIAESIARQEFLCAGWKPDKPDSDYGYDLFIQIVDSKNVVQPYPAWIQVKGTSTAGANGLPRCRLRTRELLEWRDSPVPVFLCVIEISTRRMYVISARDAISLLQDEHGSDWDHVQRRVVKLPNSAFATSARHQTIRDEVISYWRSISTLITEIQNSRIHNPATSAGAFTHSKKLKLLNLHDTWTLGHEIELARHFGLEIEMWRIQDTTMGGFIARGVLEAYRYWHLPVRLIVHVPTSRKGSDHYSFLVNKVTRGRKFPHQQLFSMPLSSNRIVEVKGKTSRGSAALHASVTSATPWSTNRWRFSTKARTRVIQGEIAEIAYVLVAIPPSFNISYTTALSDHFLLAPLVAHLHGIDKIEWEVRLLPAESVPKIVRSRQAASDNAITSGYWWSVTASIESKVVVESYIDVTTSLKRHKWSLLVHTPEIQRALQMVLQSPLGPQLGNDFSFIEPVLNPTKKRR